jgi:DsbC/DsbD-like thiol-disulfide interchange protein
MLFSPLPSSPDGAKASAPRGPTPIRVPSTGRPSGMRSILLLGGIALAAGCAGPSMVPRATMFSDEHLQVRLVSERSAWAAGDTAWLGVHFDVQEGWHLYGEGRSDSGLPIAVACDAPAGFAALPLIWPAAERLVEEGEVVDQVYHGSVMLLLGVLVPLEASSGSEATIRCAVDWLVCGTGCVPGNATLEITARIERDAGALDPAAIPLFATSRARVPRPLPDPSAGVTQTTSGDWWEIRVSGADALTFLPSVDCADLVEPVIDTAAASDRLRIRLAPDPEELRAVRGVIEARRSGESAWFRVDVPLESANNP